MKTASVKVVQIVLFFFFSQQAGWHLTFEKKKKKREEDTHVHLVLVGQTFKNFVRKNT